jgi:hypothetical protein
MLRPIKQRFDQLEHVLHEAGAFLMGLSAEKAHAHPPDAWSAAQILYHLYMSESGTVTYIRKKLEHPPKTHQRTGMMGTIRGVLLRRALRNLSKKYKAPAVVAEVPEAPNVKETLAAFAKLRRQLGAMLETFDSDMAARAYFKHPVAGKINILHTLDFMVAHFERHTLQMKERST